MGYNVRMVDHTAVGPRYSGLFPAGAPMGRACRYFFSICVCILIALPVSVRADIVLTVRAREASGIPTAYVLYNGLTEVAQESVDARGTVWLRKGIVPDGAVHEYDVSGNLRTEIMYLHNARNGVMKEFAPDGTLLRTVAYVRDRYHGPSVQFHENGVTHSISFYEGGQLHGFFCTFYESGITESVVQYRYGKRHGPAYTCFGGGELESSEEYADGLPNGTFVRFRAGLDGVSTASVCYFVKGVTEGVCTRYHDDGSIMSREVYVSGILDGPAVSFYPSGNTRNEEQYAGGRNFGEKRAFYESGMLQREGTFCLGEPEGVHREYFDTGALKKQERYVSGDIEGTVLSYHDNGQPSEEVPYVKGIRTGVSKTYDPAGRKLAETTYAGGVLHGTSVFYAPDGSVREKIVYRQGMRVVGDEDRGRAQNSGKLEMYLNQHYGLPIMCSDGRSIIPFEKIICAQGELQFYVSEGLQRAREQHLVSENCLELLLRPVKEDVMVGFYYEVTPAVVVLSGTEVILRI